MSRTIVIKFLATEEEGAEIKRQASVAGMTVSRFLRTSAVNSQAVLYNSVDIYELRSDLRKLRKQINEMGISITEHLKPLLYEVLLCGLCESHGNTYNSENSFEIRFQSRKNEEMKYVTGICCSDELENAYFIFNYIMTSPPIPCPVFPPMPLYVA